MEKKKRKKLCCVLSTFRKVLFCFYLDLMFVLEYNMSSKMNGDFVSEVFLPHFPVKVLVIIHKRVLETDVKLQSAISITNLHFKSQG